MPINSLYFHRPAHQDHSHQKPKEDAGIFQGRCVEFCFGACFRLIFDNSAVLTSQCEDVTRLGRDTSLLAAMKIAAFKFFESCPKRQSNSSAGCVCQRSLRGPFRKLILKGLILAQNERWRRGLGMQVEREPLGNWRGKWRKGQ